MAIKIMSPTILLILFIISSSTAWDSDSQPHSSYSLKRGPVFYEAYYPDNENDEFGDDYQTKDFLNREAVLEKSFQIPIERQFDYTVNEVNDPRRQYKNYPARVDNENPSWSDSYDLRNGQISIPLREMTLDHNTYPDHMSRSFILPNPDIPVSQQNLLADTKPQLFSNDPKLLYRNFDRNFDKKILLDKSLNYMRNPNTDRSQLLESSITDDQRSPIEEFDGVPVISDSKRIIPNNYQNQHFEEIKYIPGKGFFEDSHDLRPLIPLKIPITKLTPRFFNIDNKEPSVVIRQSNMEKSQLTSEVPVENIFEPRPQIINYIFSKNAVKKQDNKSAKNSPKDSIPRKYGDNIIREEFKTAKESEKGNPKITSIEVSEIPHHKIRHHHGERLRRDYASRNQNK